MSVAETMGPLVGILALTTAAIAFYWLLTIAFIYFIYEVALPIWSSLSRTVRKNRGRRA